mmetsp:Transcript_16990/g.50710  ORF Transcript_16990/g.50710 Transcript_16990/m.50710 type:complete len:215 (-) Transcript_16990:136-780(-)
MQLFRIFSICPRSSVSTGNAMVSTMATASSSARWKPRTMTVGCRFRSRNGSATCSISPARMMTEVVPSPTSSSWVLLSSMMLFAAGCDTSISLKMALPSFVMTMPPLASRSIFSMDLGPSVVLMMSETAFPAAMLLDWAFLPTSRLVLMVSTGMPPPCIIVPFGRHTRPPPWRPLLPPPAAERICSYAQARSPTVQPSFTQLEDGSIPLGSAAY